jgi:hypothetical protein
MGRDGVRLTPRRQHCSCASLTRHGDADPFLGGDQVITILGVCA